MKRQLEFPNVQFTGEQSNSEGFLQRILHRPLADEGSRAPLSEHVMGRSHMCTCQQDPEPLCRVILLPLFPDRFGLGFLVCFFCFLFFLLELYSVEKKSNVNVWFSYNVLKKKKPLRGRLVFVLCPRL